MGRAFQALETIRHEGKLVKRAGGYWEPPGKDEPTFRTGAIHSLRRQGYIEILEDEDGIDRYAVLPQLENPVTLTCSDCGQFSETVQTEDRYEFLCDMGCPTCGATIEPTEDT